MMMTPVWLTAALLLLLAAPAATSLTKGTKADKSFLQEFLKTHNIYRNKHHAPPLRYNAEMNTAAQEWADHLLAKNVFSYSKTRDGENLYFKSSSAAVKLTGKEVVDSWYSKIKDYNFSKPGSSLYTGQFTQVVWKASAELGVGVATDGHKVFVVCQYRPTGNINGKFAANVLAAR